MAEQRGPAQQGEDWTGRVPGLGRLSERSRQKVLLTACLVLVVILGIVIYLTPDRTSGGTRQAPPPVAGPSASAGPNEPTIGGGNVTADPSASDPSASDPGASGTSSHPEPSASAWSPPETDPDLPATDDHDHPGPDPAKYSPTATREPQPEDESEGKALLEQVVPAWAEADFRAVRADDAEVSSNATADKRRAWIASWREEGSAAGRSFVQLSSAQFIDLWSGAMRMQAKVADAKITESDLLWNSGGDSLWRVTVERTVEAPGISSTEQVTWDFQVSQDAGYSVVAFADPQPSNEDSDTYRPVVP